MAKNEPPVPLELIEDIILSLRGQRVMLDRDLAALYGTSTKVFNQAVKRNEAKFPSDFRFQLTQEEKQEVVTNRDHLKNLKYSPVLPYAFTEHGALMAANVLNSEQANSMSVYIVRAFVRLRETILGNSKLAMKLMEVKKPNFGELRLSRRQLASPIHRLPFSYYDDKTCSVLLKLSRVKTLLASFWHPYSPDQGSAPVGFAEEVLSSP